MDHIYFLSGELPLSIPKSLSSAMNVKIRTSLEWDGTSETKKFDDCVRLRPSKVNNFLFLFYSFGLNTPCIFITSYSIIWSRYYLQNNLLRGCGDKKMDKIQLLPYETYSLIVEIQDVCTSFYFCWYLL